MAQYSVNWSARLSTSSGTVAVGDCLVRSDAGVHFVGTTANRTTYGRCVGIASTAGDTSTPVVIMIETGIVPQEITGLAAGTVSWVRVSSAGVLERVTPGSGDDVIGKAHADGSVQLHPGVFDESNYAGGAAVVPTGTGIPHIVVGAQDAAASLIVNADVHASAAIAISKLAAIAATDIASGTLIHERGGLEADVSAYSGLVKIAAGATSAVTLAAGVETFLTTPSSTNLAAVVTDESGSGALCFVNTPTLITPVLGAATGTSAALSSFWSTGATPSTTGAGRLTNNTALYWRNAANTADRRAFYFDGSDGIWIGDSGCAGIVSSGDIHEFRSAAGASWVTFNSTGIVLLDSNGDFKYTIAPGNLAADYTLSLPVLTGADTFAVLALAQTLTNKTINGASNTLTVRLASDVSGTLPVANGGTGITALGTGVATWWATPSSANLAAACTDETGTGALVFANTPTLVTPVIGAATGTSLAATTFVSVGATVASAGSARYANVATAKVRNAGNTADLTVWQTDASDQLFLGCGFNAGFVENVAYAYIHPSTAGYLGIGGNAIVTWNASQVYYTAGVTVGINGSISVGDGVGVVGILNATTAPTTNPTAGGILYSEGGAGKWRGSGGTVTTFGPAEPHCPTCGRDFAVEHRNDTLGEHMALCLPCLVDALVAGGIDTSRFTIHDVRGATKAQWEANHAEARAREDAEVARLAAEKAAREAGAR